MKTSTYIAEVAGWYGVVAILAAYALLSFGFLDATDIGYQILNATGALGIVIDAYHAKNWQPVILNIFWLLIAIIGLIKATI